MGKGERGREGNARQKTISSLSFLVQKEKKKIGAGGKREPRCVTFQKKKKKKERKGGMNSFATRRERRFRTGAKKLLPERKDHPPHTQWGGGKRERKNKGERRNKMIERDLGKAKSVTIEPGKKNRHRGGEKLP